MISDQRLLWQPFSESPADEPLSAERELPPVDRSPFREPTAELPAIPRQAASTRRPPGSDATTPSAAG